MAPIRKNPLVRASRLRLEQQTAERPCSPDEQEKENAGGSRFIRLPGDAIGFRFRSDFLKRQDPEFFREPPEDLLRPTDQRPPGLLLSDLEALRTLGEGVEGQVFLARTKPINHRLDKPGQLIAVKSLRRKDVRTSTDYMKFAHQERSALTELPWNPFICGLIQTFHDSHSIYLGLEYIAGGTLRTILRKHAPLDAAACAFYFSNIVCALKFLESQSIMHRDFKPENILVGEDGYLCVSDFGQSSQDASALWVNVGTPSYMAPEIVYPDRQTKDISSRFAGDWWSAGVVLYEMVTSKLPFYNKYTAIINELIVRGEITWPPALKIGKNLKNIIHALLTVCNADRLGTGGSHEVMSHPWLQRVSWEKVEHRAYLAPFVQRLPSNAHRWHSCPFPAQRRIPGLRVVPPPLHHEHDNRFPEKRII